jgi:hypothetical protein
LLLLDEPSLGLAPLIVREIFRIVMGLHELGVSILLVEQNARAALEHWLIAFRADARGPRATSGQDRAYGAARDDIPDRPALSANTSNIAGPRDNLIDCLPSRTNWFSGRCS